jgi:hypothetical protein
VTRSHDNTERPRCFSYLNTSVFSGVLSDQLLRNLSPSNTAGLVGHRLTG